MYYYCLILQLSQQKVIQVLSDRAGIWIQVEWLWGHAPNHYPLGLHWFCYTILTSKAGEEVRKWEISWNNARGAALTWYGHLESNLATLCKSCSRKLCALKFHSWVSTPEMPFTDAQGERHARSWKIGKCMSKMWYMDMHDRYTVRYQSQWAAWKG